MSDHSNQSRLGQGTSISWWQPDYCTKWVEAKALRDNTDASTTKFVYKHLWCRFGCPLELIRNQGEDFLNHSICELTTHYAVVHKKSTPYYPQANGLAESTNKIMQTILKLQSALWDYRTTFKTSIQATPFWMAFGLDAVMPIELQVPSLRVQVKERLPESQSEQYRLEQLLELGEHRVASMAQLEQR